MQGFGMRGRDIKTELTISKHHVLTGFLGRLGKVFFFVDPASVVDLNTADWLLAISLPFHRSRTEMQMITSSSFLSSSS